MKIFNNNLKKNSKTIPFNKNINDVGITKYLPSFSKEWKNTVYSFNKNTLKNIAVNDLNINKIIKSYFNLFFKNRKYVGSKFIYLKRRRNLLRRIYVSNAEIKHTNNKAIITLYTVNREKKVLREKYLKINQKINKRLIWNRYINLYKKNIYKIYKILNEHKIKDVYLGAAQANSTSKKSFLLYKLQYLNKFIKLQNLYLKKFWGIIINKYARKHLLFLKKYDLLYSLNQYKFNKLVFLPVLSNILYKILGKKIEYNIINLKSIAYNTDLFTNALALKLKKRRMNYMNSMLSILNRAYIPSINALKERSLTKEIDTLHDKYEDLRIISNIGEMNTAQANISNSTNIDKLLNGIYPSNIKINNEGASSNMTNSKEIHNIIYNSIGYKNMRGIRLEIKGRLTKRYRADRSIYSLKWKGGLKNIDSSFKGLSSVLFRGNSNSNVTYTMTKSKRRIGAFAVKGWISGK